MALSKDYYISIKNGQFDDTTHADLANLFANLASHPNRDTIVVYLHGGLVSQKGAMDAAEKTLFDLFYTKAGAYPIFFFWQTGLLDVLTGNLQDIFDEGVFQRLLARVTQFVVAKLGQTLDTRGELLELDGLPIVQEELGKAKEKEPYDQWRSEEMPDDSELLPEEELQFEGVLAHDVILKNEAQKIANALRTPEEIAADEQERGGTVRGSSHTLMSPDVLEDIRDEAATEDERGIVTTTRLIKGAAAVLARTIKRFASRRDHGVYVTVIEELLHEFYLANVGKLGWDLMKGDATDAFKPDSGKHGGTAFLEGLKVYWEAGNWEAGKEPRVLLVGHSAGSIFICHLLQAAEGILPPKLKFDVVFLAPGCNFDLFAATLKKAGGRINNIRMFSMKDEGEKKNWMLGPVFPRSILYFVSGVLEGERDEPLVGMGRFFDSNLALDPEEYKSVIDGRAFFNMESERTVWSVEDSGPGRASKAAGHGEFNDEDVTTLQSLEHVVSEGL